MHHDTIGVLHLRGVYVLGERVADCLGRYATDQHLCVPGVQCGIVLDGLGVFCVGRDGECFGMGWIIVGDCWWSGGRVVEAGYTVVAAE